VAGDELERLAQNARQRAELLQERDELIFGAKTAHVPVTRIAEAVGLSAMQVHRLLRESWIVADAATGAVSSWWRTEEAAEAARAGDPTKYVRAVNVEPDGTWQ
jgi:heme-degrading monooxygenase HmoA